MKNYKVKAIINFNDLEEKVYRTGNDEFECTKERYEFLKENKAVELIEIIEEEVEGTEPTTETDETEEVEGTEEKQTKKSSKKKSE